MFGASFIGLDLFQVQWISLQSLTIGRFSTMGALLWLFP